VIGLISSSWRGSKVFHYSILILSYVIFFILNKPIIVRFTLGWSLLLSHVNLYSNKYFHRSLLKHNAFINIKMIFFQIHYKLFWYFVELWNDTLAITVQKTYQNWGTTSLYERESEGWGYQISWFLWKRKKNNTEIWKCKIFSCCMNDLNRSDFKSNN
jgi:hypothetical protein